MSEIEVDQKTRAYVLWVARLHAGTFMYPWSAG